MFISAYLSMLLISNKNKVSLAIIFFLLLYKNRTIQTNITKLNSYKYFLSIHYNSFFFIYFNNFFIQKCDKFSFKNSLKINNLENYYMTNYIFRSSKWIQVFFLYFFIVDQAVFRLDIKAVKYSVFWGFYFGSNRVITKKTLKALAYININDGIPWHIYSTLKIM